MLKVRKINYRPWPVTVKINVCDEAGVVTPVEHTFVAHFARFSEDDLTRINGDADKLFPVPENPGDLVIADGLKRSAYMLQQLVVGWGKEVLGEDDQPLPYSGDELASWITGPDGKAFVAGFNEAVLQIRFGVAPAKNSNASLAPGDAPAASEAATNSPAT